MSEPNFTAIHPKVVDTNVKQTLPSRHFFSRPETFSILGGEEK